MTTAADDQEWTEHLTSSTHFGKGFKQIVYLRVMQGEHEIRRGTFTKVLVEDLVKGKICARFVPLCLTEEQKVLRLPDCKEFIQSADEDLSWLD
jgi:hypothetical protein